MRTFKSPLLGAPRLGALAAGLTLFAAPLFASVQDGDADPGAPVNAVNADAAEAVEAVTDELPTEEAKPKTADDLYKEAVEALVKDVVGDRVDSFSVSVDAPKPDPDGLEEQADHFMGKVNEVIAVALFYPIMESKFEGELDDATAGDLAALRTYLTQFLADAEADGFDLTDSKLNVQLATRDGKGESKIDVTTPGWPFAVLWLILGAIFFTVRMGFVQLRMFGHAIQVTRGKYDHPGDEGEVSHFQALTAALSATVGLGNIAGVAIAISIGGPGATVWMIVAGFLGMASKFVECSLGQMYRQQRPDGSVMGGAMYYLSNGFKDLGKPGIGKFLAVFFAILCVGGSFGGGNSFQVNQSLNALQETIPFFADNRWVYGAIMTVVVGAVILGGLKRIAQVAEKVVPTMCGLYVAAALFVILSNAGEVPAAFGKIISGAMSPEAGFGGLIGVLIVGFKRAAFSNEAGVGSAAIAHSAAKTEFPVREGVVALLEPFIDTIVVCTMTALVIVITGAYSNPEFAHFVADNNGAGLTSAAFGQSVSWFPYVLAVAVVLFAFSTMISWSYYGERCWVWMFGDKSSLSYKVLFLTFVFLGSIVSAKNVLDFGDLMILGMAVPNVLGVLFLSGKVRRALSEYTDKLNSGEIKPID
jgi:alanine or glycine:cation symporter, AGCS family